MLLANLDFSVFKLSLSVSLIDIGRKYVHRNVVLHVVLSSAMANDEIKQIFSQRQLL